MPGNKGGPDSDAYAMELKEGEKFRLAIDYRDGRAVVVYTLWPEEKQAQAKQWLGENCAMELSELSESHLTVSIEEPCSPRAY